MQRCVLKNPRDAAAGRMQRCVPKDSTDPAQDACRGAS